VVHGGEAVNRSEWMAVTGARNILRDEAEILENFAQRSENDSGLLVVSGELLRNRAEMLNMKAQELDVLLTARWTAE